MAVSTKEQRLLARLDGSGSDDEREAVDALRECSDLPALLLSKYQSASHANERASCLYYAARYATTSASAFELGVVALNDRSTVVRYRATLLLAVSQNRDALKPLAVLHASGRSVEDAAAAMDAISHRDPNLFVDRDHSGKVTLSLE